MQLSKININFEFVKFFPQNFTVQKKQLSYRQSVIEYHLFGNGSQPVICFHGYGETAETYGFLEKYAGDRYTFIAFDLPFHGGTKWEQGLDFTVDDLEKIILRIIDAEPALMTIPEDKNLTRFILLGYSLGGRVALSLYEAHPGLFSRMVLLAPDGLRVNPWYWLATQTWLGNRLFRYTMDHPGWFFFLLNMFNRLGWVNASVHKFVQFYIGNHSARRILYQRWTSLRRLRPQLSRIRRLLQKHDGQVRLIYGNHDRIILPVRGEAFISGLGDRATLRVIASGHQVLQEKHVNEILSALRDEGNPTKHST